MQIPRLGPRGEGWVALQVLLMIGVVASALLPPRWPDAIEDELAPLGLALAVVGGVIALWAGFVLGHALTPFSRPRAEGVIERGPYRVVRHPMYAGGMLFFVGISLLATVASFVLALVLAVVWGLKAEVEEAALAEQFLEYETYRQRVRYRFVPDVF
jgi:protein-S-isoprenylcysteine O-methyltransferase Ste14